ncbi:MAG: winged helix-turn-helix transcriptional regulator [Nitrososphaerota archaeon]|nr:winged helix-turn-helix transcriptional regulator [Nitrososphaerota archaeon]
MSLKEMALETIMNEKRRDILHVLEKRDKSFSEIQSGLKMDKGSLTYHMKELVRGGLAANIYERRGTLTNAKLYRVQQQLSKCSC